MLPVRTLLRRRVFSWTLLGAALISLMLATSGCEEGSINAPDVEAGDRFARYVAVGNSITAGFQSNGINQVTQRQSYAAIFANVIDTEFSLPLIPLPGCPPPLISFLPAERLGGPAAPECTLRSVPLPRVLNNVAVPGARTLDALQNSGPGTSPNALTTLILGGRTQVEAAADAEPTFASVWLGNNDVLGAALAGDASRITPLDAFQDRMTQVLDELEAGGADSGVLLAVSNVTLIPALSPGAAYVQAEAAGVFPPNFNVDESCASTDPAPFLVPVTYGFGELLAQATANPGATVTLNCADDAPVLTPTETAVIAERVQQYNAFLAQEAQDRGWAFADINPLLAAERANGAIPLFPQVDTDTPFGPLFSLDGVHPSLGGHIIAANAVINAVNETYGTTIEAATADDVPAAPEAMAAE